MNPCSFGVSSVFMQTATAPALRMPKKPVIHSGRSWARIATDSPIRTSNRRSAFVTRFTSAATSANVMVRSAESSAGSSARRSRLRSRMSTAL